MNVLCMRCRREVSITTDNRCERCGGDRIVRVNMEAVNTQLNLLRINWATAQTIFARQYRHRLQRQRQRQQQRRRLQLQRQTNRFTRLRLVAEPCERTLLSEEVLPESTPECTICMTDLKIGDRIHELSCRHKFHPDCISPWLRHKRSCPNCRQAVP